MNNRIKIPSQARALSAAALAFASLTLGFGQTVDPSLYSGLVWRNIGPFRGGRVAAVTGVIGQPGVFYMGMPLGGVWKTTSAGQTWFPVFDAIKDASSVGSVEVAPSNPNIIYVGMGDMITGGGINEGNGVYKSTDAGKTWVHLGLDETKQIPSILVDPHNPDIVMVATQGNVHKKSDMRGLYRSTDGGKTWKKTLYVDDETGVQKIAWAYDQPNVMLATTVHHYNAPGAGGRRGGGAGGGAGAPSGTKLYKSTDEGVTWKEIDSEDLPELAGRTCVAVAMNTHAKRMFLVGNFGLYRSDDGGLTWNQMDAPDRRVANGQGGYNCGVYVNSKNPDIVYVINTSSYISKDGGKTFTGFKGAPGGDDPQQMWIDPTDGQRLFLGTDQGATISLDGGGNWSSWYNQPTAQVYHISTDTQFPYWVYATQQDSGSIGTRSRGNFGEVTPMDWLPHPGYEFGSIVADPKNPNVSYAGGPGGGIIKVTYPSGQWINVSPNVDTSEQLRKVGNQPVAFSQANPKELLVGFQYLMASNDGGMHWKKLSPDLGWPKGVTPPKPGSTPADAPRPGAARPGAGRPGAGAPPAGAAGGAGAVGTGTSNKDMDDDDRDDDGEAEMDDPDLMYEAQFGANAGGAIESFSSSPVNGGTIWVGTNNGLLKVTKDHGATWTDVTIPKLPNPTRADISAIDASHQDPATAYVAIDYHTSGDYNPYFYKTHDYGQTWTKIVDGLPTDMASGSFARVIRADTKREGLLFAGTESFVYVSFNDGNTWQSLALNAPNTSYRDMVVHGNDLVVGTYGRSFWVLDDISPLRQITASMAAEPAHLFKPGDAVRVRRNVNGDTPFPPEVPHALNPPDGALIYYYLNSPPSGSISVDVADSKGNEVRHFSSDPIPPSNDPPPPVPDFWVWKPLPMPSAVGMNRINWDLRYDSPPSLSHSYEINANPGLTPPSPQGPLVAPGDYTVTLTVDGKAYKQTVTVVNDPRSPAKGADVQAQVACEVKLYNGIKTAWDANHAVAKMKAEIQAAIGSSNSDELKKAAADIMTKLTAIGGATGGGRRRGGGGGGGFRGGAPAGPPSFSSVDGALVRELNTLDPGDMRPSEPQMKACDHACDQLKTVEKAWSEFNTKEMPKFNALLAKNGLKAIAPATGFSAMR